MKFILQTILTAVLAFVLQMFLPWWMIIVAAFAVAAIVPQKTWLSFMAGFLGIGLLWGIQALMADMSNAGILSERIAGVFSLSSGTMMILVTAVIGAVAGGMGALSGRLLRDLV